MSRLDIADAADALVMVARIVSPADIGRMSLFMIDVWAAKAFAYKMIRRT